ncbi:MAG TPA: hypothetical protein VLH40_06645 [Atribacteraceae bacterium]|nr:hypothetical protein [Atribacteraceae bacterium]
MSESHHLADTESLRERIDQLESLITQIETELNETLGVHGEEESSEEAETAGDFLSRFADVLASIQEQERYVVKAPPERWKSIQMKDVIDLGRVNLEELLGLYRTYLTKEKTGVDIKIDDEFKDLIEQRQVFLEGFFCRAPQHWHSIGVLLQNTKDRKADIATFLVLLDMVFRKILIMRDDQGIVSFRKNDLG